MTQRRKLGRKLLSFLLTLVLVLGLMPGMGLTAYAADEVSENISLVASQSAGLKTISGTHYSVSCGYLYAAESGMQVCKAGALTINARKGETITKVVLTYNWGNNKSSLSASAGTFDGNATISDINAQQVTISSSNTAGVKISAVTVYFEGSLSNPTVTLTGGANAKSSGGLLTQSYLPGAMDTVTYTALTGAAFPAFENFTQNGVTVERTSDTVVTISGTPTANTEITVPDAESSSKIVTWDSSIINDSGRNGIGYQIDRYNSYSDTANGITLTKSGSGYASLDYGDWMLSGDVTLNFTTATGKFTSIEIETSSIYDGGNWTKDGNTLKWNGTPSNSVSLSGSSLYLEGVSSINFVIEMPTVSVTITAGDHMTKTAGSGDAEQTGLTGAMTDVVYTADNGYYYPTDYSVAEVSGIKVTRDSYTQITVSGTPTADAAIALTAPTAKTTPDAPTTATATDCTTADNNDGTLTGVTTAMEYKKSDAEDWTAGTGSDITGLVPGTYYVRVKATDTTNASANQELTVKGFISYTVTFKVVNGKWNEGEGDAATADKTVTLTGYEGDTLKLTADQIPAVGTKPNDTYKAGSWDTTPSTDTAITADTTYTYTYAQKDSISQTVTFKVVNGSWNDETTTDKTVTLTGYEGDTLKLSAAQIPAVGSKPNDTYKAGSWDVTPSTETAITEATTYTYTYAAKEASVVTKAPEAKTLTYNGSAQELVTAGTATGGTMQYALGTATEATEPYTTSIPAKTNAGTYYVWYKVVGDANHNSTEPNSVEAKINPVDKTDLNTAIEEAEAYYESIKEDDVYAQVAEALKKAIDEAKKYTNDNVAEKEVKEAIDTIKAAKVDAEEGKKEADDTEAAKKVTDAINALSASDKVATTDKAAIEAARKAYDALTADQKAKVTPDTLKKLEAAEKALATAEKKETDDTDAAKKVNDAIGKLPASDKVATTDKAAIEAARKAYDALTADQKKKVSADTLKKLTDAEAALNTAEAKDKAAKELEAAKAEAQAAMNEQVTVTQKGNKFTVKWKKSTSADGYYVYAQYCGKKATKPAKTITKNTTTKTTITKINGKKINQKRQFRVYVVPYKIIDGKKVALGKSTVAHLVGAKSTKYSNVKKLTLTKKKYTVKVGKTAKIKAKVTLVNNNKKHIPKSHGAKFRYKSSDTSIATVDKNGKIKGIKTGTCTIYVYSINGLMKKVKITVK